MENKNSDTSTFNLKDILTGPIRKFSEVYFVTVSILKNRSKFGFTLEDTRQEVSKSLFYFGECVFIAFFLLAVSTPDLEKTSPLNSPILSQLIPIFMVVAILLFTLVGNLMLKKVFRIPLSENASIANTFYFFGLLMLLSFGSGIIEPYISSEVEGFAPSNVLQAIYICLIMIFMYLYFCMYLSLAALNQISVKKILVAHMLASFVVNITLIPLFIFID